MSSNDLRALDAEFHEKVLGWKNVHKGAGTSWYGTPPGEPTVWLVKRLDLTAAWAGVEKVCGKKLACVDFVETASGWCCEISTTAQLGKSEWCATPAEALVRACLAAAARQ